ncbi:recombination regulator RecX [Lampropedia cohaerens]|uniref:recombination regulator RecX n=1 Tax=Lampropedia cohaerens TaxID=1610491 RepID=UPI000AC7C9AA|nr:recombination regulator RecX [Lampropedia cohaerens]
MTEEGDDALPASRRVGARRGATAPSLLARGLQALARREYARAELARKLAPHAESAQALEAVLDQLQAKGFLSDARAAEALVRQKAARFGAVRIRHDLQARGLDKELVDAALAPLEDDEFERARQVWGAKFGGQDLQALDWQARQKERARQMRFLAARGFCADVVRKVMRAADGAED